MSENIQTTKSSDQELLVVGWRLDLCCFKICLDIINPFENGSNVLWDIAIETPNDIASASEMGLDENQLDIKALCLAKI